LETRRQKSGCKAPAQPPADRGDKGNTEATGSVIANWVEEEQPRARLSRYGAGQMSTAELLGICLVSGVPGEDAVQLARRLLSEFGGIGSLPHEAFACLFLNAKHELLGFEVLFRGSIDRTHVHAREVLKRGLELNAAAVIVSHNHPSGSTEPSQADIALTRSLSNLLQQVEIRLLDHVVVGAGGWVSLHTRGLI